MGIDWNERSFLRGLDRGLERYEDDAERALDASTDGIVDRARALAPVDEGNLRDSIHKQAGQDANGPYVDVVADDEAAIYQEFGTSEMDANPFLRPAFAEAPAEFGSGLR